MHGYIISKGYRELERSFKIYCKLDGQLKKQFSLGGSEFEFVTLFGRDRLVIQNEYSEGIQIIDVIFEIPRLIIDVFSIISLFVWTRDEPFCLDKGHHMKNKKP